MGYSYVDVISNSVYIGVFRIGTCGISGYRTVYRVLSNVRVKSGRAAITNAVQEDIETDSVPVFQFAVFYNGLMEFSDCATFVIGGRVHANGPIYVGSPMPLTFSGLVTTTKTISAPAWAGFSATAWTGAVNYNGSPAPGYQTNYPALTLPIGIGATNSIHVILEQPTNGESPDSVRDSNVCITRLT